MVRFSHIDSVGNVKFGSEISMKTFFSIKLFYSKNDRLFNYESINDIFYTNSKITIVSREGTSNNISLEVSKELSFEIKEWML